MLTAYALTDDGFRATPMDPGQPPPPGTVWFDLLEPTRDETHAIERRYAIDLPSADDMREIEESARLYHEDGATFMTATLLRGIDTGRASSTQVTFVRVRDVLVTQRFSQLKAFTNLPHRLAREAELCRDADRLLAALLEGVLDRLADVLERVDGDLDRIADQVFAEPAPADRQGRSAALAASIRDLGRSQQLVAKASESLLSLVRLLSFLIGEPGAAAPTDGSGQLARLRRDAKSMIDHTAYLLGNISFHLDTVLGLVNIEQNKAIRIFSMIAVVFVPPTLIASIYGMNFQLMPELAWPWGYPFALGLMLASAVIPFVLFRRKGWL